MPYLMQAVIAVLKSVVEILVPQNLRLLILIYWTLYQNLLISGPKFVMLLCFKCLGLAHSSLIYYHHGFY